MADVIRKRVTLHPLKKNGQMDLNVNLYPKCFVDGVVDRNGNPVNVVTSNSSELNIDEKFAELQDEIDAKGDVTSEELAQAVANKAEITLIELNDLMSEETIASMGAFLIGWTEVTYNIWYFNEEIDLSELKDETFIGFHYLLHGDDESIISDTLLLFTKEYCTNDEPVFVLNRLSPTINVSHLSLTLASNGIVGLQQLNTDAAPHWGNIEGNIQEQSDLQAVLNNKQDVIADLDSIRAGAAAGAAAVSQDDFNNAIGDVEDRLDELEDKFVPYCYLRFEYDQKDERPVLTDWTEGLLTNEWDWQPILLSVNGNLAEVWHIEAWTSNNRVTIDLYNDMSSIEIRGDIDTEPNQWEVDLSAYFAPLNSDNDFYPYIVIENGEKVNDNVLEADWVTDFRHRLDALMFAPVPAKLVTGIDDIDGEPVTIYATREGESKDDPIIVHIRTSNGEYKLFYIYGEDPL